MLFASVIVSASLIPYPIFVKLNAGVPIGYGVDVKIQNLDCNDASKCVIERIFQTNDNGEIALDAYDTQRGFEGFRDTDRFKATILYCQGESACNQEMSFTSSGGRILFNFDLTGVSCLPTIIKEVPSDCPSCPTCEVCSVCPEPEVCPESDCPVQDMTAERIIEGIIILIVGMGVYKYGFGIKVYTKKDGTVEVQHKHPNVIAYHNINTKHRTQPHKKGELKPKYEATKNANGYYKYIGEA